MMNLLEMLTGNGQTREGFKDFLNRFEEGPPSEGYEDQEVLDRYGEVAHRASPSDYEQAARDAFGRLSQADREEFGQLLAGRAQSKRLDLPGLTPAQGQGFGDVDWLANITNQIHQQPGLLRDLLGGLTGNKEGSSSGGILSSPLAKAALAGIAAMLVKKVLGGR
jgi:hypothetical protein